MPHALFTTIVKNPAPAGLDLSPARNWFLVYSTPRGEARAEAALRDAGCQTFWPSSHKRVTKGPRILFDGDVATYPRYLFASGLPFKDRFRDRLVGETVVTIKGRPVNDIRDFDGVQDVIGTASGWLRVPNAAIAAIAGYQDTPEPVAAVPSFAAGDSALVIAGPFMGFAATVIEAIGLADARVTIDLLGGKVPATMPIEHLSAA